VQGSKGALVVAVLAAGLVCCKPSGGNSAVGSESAPLPPSAAASAGATAPAGPSIQITLTLSPAAAQQISQTGQTITLPATFYGLPTSPQLRAQVQGRLEVAPEQDVTLNGAGPATILVPPLDASKLGQIENGQVMVAIDVSSGNHTSQNNLLDCDTYMDVPLQQAETQPTTLNCKLIGEP
jgi:hypothetical protein